jgi:hypothetical protein
VSECVAISRAETNFSLERPSRKERSNSSFILVTGNEKALGKEEEKPEGRKRRKDGKEGRRNMRFMVWAWLGGGGGGGGHVGSGSRV